MTSGDSAAPVPGWIFPTRTWRIAFWCFAAALFTMTHWPKLRVPGPTGTDLVAHMLSFGTWTILFGFAAWIPARFSPRSIGLGFLVGVLYAAVDEGLQAVPILGRTCSWSDYGANVLGVSAATVVLFILGTMTKVRPGQGSPGSTPGSGKHH